MFEKIYKRCPRCEEKNPKNAYKCSTCGLVFDRLKLATNKAGRKMLNEGKKDKVLWVKDFPSDIQRRKAIMLVIFLGLFGAHCYYVGRITKAIMMSVFGSLTIIGGILMVKGLIPQEIFLTSQVIVGIPIFVWFFDIWAVCIKNFKVPISIDTGADDK